MPVKQLLIFDSGVGGLSIFQEVIKRVTNINCYYLSDNAYFPYGELDENALISRLTELLQRFVEKHPVDMIVIACNSASTVALTALRAFFSIPIVGVVPAIKPANLMTTNGIIGLVATPATINREYTQKLVNEFARDKSVLKLGSTQLVKIAEQKLQGKVVDLDAIKAVFQPWLSLNNKPDTLVLGCTHFPLLKTEISECFNDQIQLVDSGEAIANRVVALLGGAKSEGKIQQKADYDAFYTLTDEKQLLLESTFLKLNFKSFSLFEA
ncbi:glutamate racemase [Psychromonas sp. KJ10-10]|uniref:glutamate racemase n=1 Tax=Psychromonas sp. KJ10-10 TaxID=3391823 RepID=UPI0039B6D019